MKAIAASFFALLRDRTASVTVEFVVILPVLLTALVFAYELGRGLLAYEIMTSDVRSAVRYLSHVPLSDSLAASSTYVVAATNLAECGTLSSTCAAKHFPWNSSSTASLTVTPAAKAFSSPTFAENGSVLEVTASVPITLAFLAYMGIDTTYTLVVADEARRVGN